MRRILDTSILIRKWRVSRSASSRPPMVGDVERWADEIVEFERTHWIVTPVEIEFLAGVMSREELVLARAFLDRFELLDGGEVFSEDWDGARQLACRVPRQPRPRQLGDCLIRAIADRFGADVTTSDLGFPS